MEEIHMEMEGNWEARSAVTIMARPLNKIENDVVYVDVDNSHSRKLC